jgi:large subunit ribosomal protein L16
MEGVPKELAQQAFQLAQAKLPFKVTFAERQVM